MDKKKNIKEKWVIKFTDTNTYYSDFTSMLHVESIYMYNDLASCEAKIERHFKHSNAKPQKVIFVNEEILKNKV